MNLEIDRDRLLSEIEALAAISDADPPAVTRVVFTPTDLKARAWLRKRCEDAELTLRQDPIGNIFARWVGTDASAPAVGTGSHIDAIPNAGKYDGVVGVLGGLEAIRALQRGGFRPKHSIELLVFTSEEPTRFGIGCLGSRLLSGSLSVEAAKTLKDAAGESIEDIRRKAGLLGELDNVKLPNCYYKAFVELHIEQGPLLEHRQLPLGVVLSIAAPASMRITIEGAGGHAGGVRRRSAATRFARPQNSFWQSRMQRETAARLIPSLRLAFAMFSPEPSTAFLAGFVSVLIFETPISSVATT